MTGNVQKPLYKKWYEYIPQWDQAWISSALFRPGKTTAELIADHELKLWYYPPQPLQMINTMPSLTPYFGQRLFCWMPKRMWKITLECPSCGPGFNMVKGGIHPTVRQVLDIDSFYYMVTEDVKCSKCHKRVPSWSSSILNQLDPGHKSFQ